MPAATPAQALPWRPQFGLIFFLLKPPNPFHQSYGLAEISCVTLSHPQALDHCATLLVHAAPIRGARIRARTVGVIFLSDFHCLRVNAPSCVFLESSFLNIYWSLQGLEIKPKLIRYRYHTPRHGEQVSLNNGYRLDNPGYHCLILYRKPGTSFRIGFDINGTLCGICNPLDHRGNSPDNGWICAGKQIIPAQEDLVDNAANCYLPIPAGIAAPVHG